MFKIGDEVRVRSNGANGVVSYVEDGYFCVDLDNGAEMGFEDGSLLQLATDYDAEWNLKSAILAKRGAVNLPPLKTEPGDLRGLPYIPRKGDRAVARAAMEIVDRLAPMLLDGVREQVENFNSLDAFDQVKALSAATYTPMVVFMGAAEMGTDELMRAVLSKTLVNNIINRSDLVSDMILGHAKRVIAEYEKEN